MPPDTNPISAPVRFRSVGAAHHRTANTIMKKGPIAVIGIETRQSAHCPLNIISGHCRLGTLAKLADAAEITPANGRAVKVSHNRNSPPGRASLVRYTAAMATIDTVKVSFIRTKDVAFGSAISGRMPNARSTRVKANSAPTRSANPTLQATRRVFAGCTFAL